MSNKIWIFMLCSALLLACKPTPRTAAEPHKEAPTAQPQQEQAEQQPQESIPAKQPESHPCIGLLEISVTRQDYNRLRPWEKQNATNGHFMGVYLGNGRVLTLGRAARAATYTELSLPDASRTVPARVIKFDEELDLALLTVEHPEDADIFNNMPELSIGEPLSLSQSAGAEVCALVRSLVQVRIGVDAESVDDDANHRLPRLELRAAKPLPQGNAAGLPILRNGKLVALVEEYSPREQSLTCLNAEFISRFLDESSAAGNSVPVLGLVFAELNDPAFNKYLKLDPQQGGIYVSQVQPGSSAEAAGVQVGDVVTSIDDLPLDKLGRGEHPLYGLLGARHIISSLKPVGQQIALGISRNGEAMELHVPLNRDAVEKSLLGQEAPGIPPRYVMWGGLLFQPLSQTYLDALQKSANSLPLPFLHVKKRLPDLQSEGIKEIVALTLVVPTPATLGYDSLGFCVVEHVNDQRVTSFAQFAEMLDAPTADGVTELSLNRPPYHIYLDRQAVETSNDTIRRRAIPRLRQMGPEPAAQP